MEIISKTYMNNEELKENFMDLLCTYYNINSEQEQFIEEKFLDILYEISIKVQDLVLDRFEKYIPTEFVLDVFKEISIDFINNLAKEMNLEKKD